MLRTFSSTGCPGCVRYKTVLASMLKPVCYLHLATACFTTGLFKSCPSAPLLRRCLPSIGACLVLPTRAWVGQEYVLRWVLPRTRKFSELCGPTVRVPSPTSAVSAASSSWLHCLASGVLLCLLVGSPPLPVVGGRLPQLRNGRPEARLRWSEPGSSPPLAALPCFGARFLSLTHSLTHSLILVRPSWVFPSLFKEILRVATLAALPAGSRFSPVCTYMSESVQSP